MKTVLASRASMIWHPAAAAPAIKDATAGEQPHATKY